MSSAVRFAWIPDTQVKPGVPTDHLEQAANYIAEKRPSVIVIGGDWYDMPSLSSYDRGKKAAEGRRYEDDIAAGSAALALFERTLKKNAPKGYKPQKHVVLGNHEQRVERAIEEDARMDGTMSMDDFAFKQYGWTVHPFLRPVQISGINFVHYCALNANGQVSNGKHGCDAKAQGRRFMGSTVSGHRQGIDIAYTYTPTKTVVSVVAGSFYQHAEKYLTEQGDRYWRGILILNDVRPTGEFDPMPVSLDYLRRVYR